MTVVTLAVLAVLILVPFGLHFAVKSFRTFSAAGRKVSQSEAALYYVVDQVELDGFRSNVPVNDKCQFDKLISEIASVTGGVVRQGHILWLIDVLEGKATQSSPPELNPPPSIPYSSYVDSGLPFLRRYLVEHSEGRLVEAFRQIRAGVDMKSPACQAIYAVQGLQEGVDTVETREQLVALMIDAVNRGYSPRELALLKLRGAHLPVDVPGGLGLLSLSAMRGDKVARTELCRIHLQGKHGVPIDEDVALVAILPLAPRWRQIAQFCGIEQWAWMYSYIARAEKISKEFNSLSPFEQQKITKNFVKSRNHFGVR